MSAVVKWWSRLAAAVSGMALTLVVPVHAWAAAHGAGDVAIEAAKYRRRGGFGFFPFVGGLCCLFVVAAVVVVVLLVRRGRRRKD
jgi:hypothetical protein